MANNVEAKVRKASALLHEAFEESPCKWCARNLDKLSKITSDMADIAPYTEETSKRVSAKTQAELQEIGGKVGVLRRVVADAHDDNITDVNESLYNYDGNDDGRGVFMDRKGATMAVIGAVGIGGVAGVLLNRVNEMVTPGQPFYMSVAPWGNIIGGIALTYLAGSKWVKGDKSKLVLTGGGLGMVGAGANYLFEGMYRMAIGTAGAAPAARYVNARMPGQLPGYVRVVQQTKSF